MTRRDHGGNLDEARARFGGADWIDLSTGINRRPYPLPPLPPHAWRDLPTRADIEALAAAAARRYGAGGAVLPLAGAQAAIQLYPRLERPGAARVLGPTYNEHAASLRAAGWRVREVATPEALCGADLAVIVNPDNPTGRDLPAATLTGIAAQVGRLVVDESFRDPTPAASVVPAAGGNLLVLRSFGKFYGLAGLRLGFAIGGGDTLDALAAMAGPWAVSGPACAIGRAALDDAAWAREAADALARDALRLDRLAEGAGWRLEGGTALFRLYDTPDAGASQEGLARHAIWSRIFPWSARAIRLGLPGHEHEWSRLATALSSLS
ncbi:threonine-phosphate decarboxylase [Palleronia sediminis]|uniref:threonine-phosphate decarboxylase n=1 Tax=Palleronia sediminis TaxID=2547833 RepID=A0A4R6AF19_9RHOB|nr:threonine-phosphate decarboxylase CobD [Palleronia sediminis]TDL81765.1 threonine-phosphate decarboxylase [Palleronia sediminis]